MLVADADTSAGAAAATHEVVPVTRAEAAASTVAEDSTVEAADTVADTGNPRL
jgi:hypothetical protein